MIIKRIGQDLEGKRQEDLERYIEILVERDNLEEHRERDRQIIQRRTYRENCMREEHQRGRGASVDARLGKEGMLHQQSYAAIGSEAVVALAAAMETLWSPF